jgi:predicted TIM-barrel fold metal-dependent hydrolase
MIIDAHTHLTAGDSTLTVTAVAECERLGVDRIVCSAIAGYRHYPTFEQVSRSNDDLHAVMQAHPGLVQGYCYVNPRHGRPALDDLRRRIEDQGMIGIKLWVATRADDPLVDPVVEQAIAYRAPILVHAWRKTVGQLSYESTAQDVARLGERYPEATIIMAHLGGQTESAVNAIAPYRNVRTDTSGSLIGGAEVAIAVERLGAERVIFGSDLHGGDLAVNVGKIIAAELPPAEQDLVLGGNMDAILKAVAR